MPQDHLAHTERVLHVVEARIVAARPQAGEEVPEPGLQPHDAVVLHAPARSVERSLRIVAVVDDPAHNLEVALRLHRPAHDTERPE